MERFRNDSKIKKRYLKLKKQMIGLTAVGMLFCLNGCNSVVFSNSLTDHVLLSGTKTRLTLEECSLVFLDFQTRYNLYYQNLGENNFWEEKAGESDFSNYLRDGRVKEELCTLVLLNDMASELGVTITEEDRAMCQTAAADYYGSLSSEEREYVQSDESKVQALYEKYRVAQKAIDVLCADINTEVSDNDKRVMILQLIASPSREEIEQAKERISSGEDFETVAKEISRFSQVEYQVSRGTLNPILEETAFYMSDGDVSNIIQTEENYYLIRCVDDFDEALSAANESKVLEKLRYATWSKSFVEYATTHSVAVSEEIWNKMHFYQTLNFSSDDLYETYEMYFERVDN